MDILHLSLQSTAPHQSPTSRLLRPHILAFLGAPPTRRVCDPQFNTWFDTTMEHFQTAPFVWILSSTNRISFSRTESPFPLFTHILWLENLRRKCMIQVEALTSLCGGKAFGVRVTSMLPPPPCIGETSEAQFPYLRNGGMNTWQSYSKY